MWCRSRTVSRRRFWTCRVDASEKEGGRAEPVVWMSSRLLDAQSWSSLSVCIYADLSKDFDERFSLRRGRGLCAEMQLVRCERHWFVSLHTRSSVVDSSSHVVGRSSTTKVATASLALASHRRQGASRSSQNVCPLVHAFVRALVRPGQLPPVDLYPFRRSHSRGVRGQGGGEAVPGEARGAGLAGRKALAVWVRRADLSGAVRESGS